MTRLELTFARSLTAPVLTPGTVRAAEAVFVAVGRLTRDATRYRTAVGHVMDGVPGDVGDAVAQAYGDLPLGERAPLAEATAWPPLADACHAALATHVPAARSLSAADRQTLAWAIPAEFRHACEPREPVADRLALGQAVERATVLAVPNEGGERPDPLVAARFLGRLVSVSGAASTWLDTTDVAHAALFTSLWDQVGLLCQPDSAWGRRQLDRMAAAWSLLSRHARAALIDLAPGRELLLADTEAALQVLPRLWPDLRSQGQDTWQEVARIATSAFVAARVPALPLPASGPMSRAEDGLAARYTALVTATADEPELRRLQWAGWITGLRALEEAGERPDPVTQADPWATPPTRVA